MSSKKKLLKRHTIIIVSDGISNGISLDVATDFLKPIVTKQIILATPLCSSGVIDRVRLMTDAFFCLDVIESGFPLKHYYDDNELPDHDVVIKMMHEISLHW